MGNITCYISEQIPVLTEQAKIELIRLSPSVSTFDQNSDFKIRMEHQKIFSYKRCAYESVDDRSLFWVIHHRSSETSTPGLKGLLGYLVSCV